MAGRTLPCRDAPIPRSQPNVYTQGHPGVGGQAAASGVGPSERNAAIAASNAKVHVTTRLMESPFRSRSGKAR